MSKVSKLLIASVLVIAVGVCVSAVFDSDSKVGGGTSLSHTVIGVTLMVLASTFEAAKTVISQVLMDKMTLFDGIYYSSPTFVLLAVVFVGGMEAKQLYHYQFNGMVVGLLFANMLSTGAIVLSSFWFVKLAGALTLKVVTQDTARSIGLILCSVFFFGEFCTGMQYTGYTLTLVGMGMFDYAKQELARLKELKALKESNLGRSAAARLATAPREASPRPRRAGASAAAEKERPPRGARHYLAPCLECSAEAPRAQRWFRSVRLVGCRAESAASASCKGQRQVWERCPSLAAYCVRSDLAAPPVARRAPALQVGRAEGHSAPRPPPWVASFEEEIRSWARWSFRLGKGSDLGIHGGTALARSQKHC
ncbi:unnamed protein product [Prorocentrum cordatum]|uniref:Sugar phosphate transporter domain-containing protein n=1 Tax=Prorocentrum cordatum TaxID=2364126 RepID=A0ABN9WDR7_9DINO|nr:unnamed protein product [Polarella glacialis]